MIVAGYEVMDWVFEGLLEMDFLNEISFFDLKDEKNGQLISGTQGVSNSEEVEKLFR